LYPMRVLRHVKRPLSISLLLLLLLSTSGFSLHAIYCLCKGELRYSLFATDQEDQHCTTSGEGTCCVPGNKAAVKTGCGPSGPACCAPDNGDTHPCTAEEVIYTRLAAVFLAQGAEEAPQQEATTPSGPPAHLVPSYLSGLSKAALSPHNPWPRGPGIRFPGLARHLVFAQFRC
jgi:hypothetical protein